MEATLPRLDAIDLKKLLTPSEYPNRRKAFYLLRNGGLGDVVMALAAATAVRAKHPEARVCLLTDPRYGALARACPALDEVFTESSRVEESIRESYHRNFQVLRADLGPINFGINRAHEVDAFLEFLDQHAESTEKDARVALPDADALRARLEPLLRGPGRRIALHPGIGDANRTWPAASWGTLVDRILRAGHTPVVVGDSGATPFKGVLKLPPRPGLVDLTDQLSLSELITVLGLCDVFVTTDSGPAQVAGLTDVGLVGIYTTVRAHCRLPFRHGMAAWRAIGLEPDCPFKGCYLQMLTVDQFHSQLQQAGHKDLAGRGNSTAINEFMGNFCALPSGPRHGCLIEITPDRVWAACERLLTLDAMNLADLYHRARGHITNGDPRAALADLAPCLDAPWNAEARFQQAIATALLGQVDEALFLLVRLIEDYPGPEALNLAGLLLYHKGETGRGAELLEKAMVWNGAYRPAQANLALHRATESLIAGKPVDGLLALDIFKQILAGLDPGQDLFVFPPENANRLHDPLVAILAGEVP